MSERKAQKKSRPGRPGKFKVESDSVLVQTRLPVALFKKVKARADKLGHSVASYLRFRVTESVR